MIEAILRAAILLLEVIFRLKMQSEPKDLVKEGLSNEDPTLVSIGLKSVLSRVRDKIRYYPERFRTTLQDHLHRRERGSNPVD